MSTARRPEPEPRPEPTGLRIGDLVALVAGAGLAMALTWHSQWPSRRTLAGRPAPEWYIILLYATEITRKGCLALVPVILMRRVRNGGPMRPGELAALCFGIDLLLLAVYQSPVLGILSLTPGTKDVYTVNMGPFWTWYVAILALSLAAVVLLFVRRRQLPGWVAGLLLCAGWYGLHPCEVIYKEAFDALFGDGLMGLPMVARFAIHSVAASLPFSVLGHLPTAFAALDGMKPQAGRTWVERAGLAMTLGLWIVGDCRNFARFWLDVPALQTRAIVAFNVVMPLLVIALSFALARRLDATLRRWLGLAEPRTGPSV